MLSEPTRKEPDSGVEPLGPVAFKGIAAAVDVFAVRAGQKP